AQVPARRGLEAGAGAAGRVGPGAGQRGRVRAAPPRSEGAGVAAAGLAPARARRRAGVRRRARLCSLPLWRNRPWRRCRRTLLELTMYTAKGTLNREDQLRKYSPLVRRLAHHMI